jgi:hypothetical protein
MGITLHGGPTGEPGRGLIYQGLRRNERGLWKWSNSVCGNSMKGTWRRARILGILKDMLRSKK